MERDDGPCVLVRPEDIRPEQQWIVRPAETLDQTNDAIAYYIAAQNLGRSAERLNRTYPARRTPPAELSNPYQQGDFGWFCNLGIFHGGVVGIYATGKVSPEDKTGGVRLCAA